MTTINPFSTLLQSFFTDRLMKQRNVSTHTIASYRDTFRLLLEFAHRKLKKPPSKLAFDDLNAPFIGAFLDYIQRDRKNGTRTRNLRLTAIRSFFKYAAFQEPTRSAHIQRVLAIPTKRQDRPLIDFLTHPEIQALLAAPDKNTWIGRRDHALLWHSAQSRWCPVPPVQACGKGQGKMFLFEKETSFTSCPSSYRSHGTPSGRRRPFCYRSLAWS